MTKLIDLTHLFTADMPVYPGDPCVEFFQSCFIESDGVTDHSLKTCMHVGTHIDAPLHMIEGGAKICDIPLDQCEGRGVIIDARNHARIDVDLLSATTLNQGDIVLLYTGWGSKFRDPDYFTNWPTPTEDFAYACVEAGIAMLGMDVAGPDLDAPFPIHKILLGNDILIAENLTNLDALIDNRGSIHIRAYPMKYDADAAPVRLVAEIQQENA